jgi:hypothetical protein
MKLNIQDKFKKLKNVLTGNINADQNLNNALSGMELNLGMANDSSFDVPPSAIYNPVYVGCKDSLGKIVANDELKMLMKKDSKRVGAKPVFDSVTGKYNMHYFKQGVTDSDPFIPGQLFSPWLVSYFEDIFTKPLLYTNFREMVKVYSGSNPWAKLMNLYLSDFAGFASFRNSGTMANNMSRDINVKSGMMTSEVINMDVTYSLQIEEQELSKRSDYPFANKLMSMKPMYAKYVLDLLEAFLGYYGNSSTGTEGLLSINTIDSWDEDTLAAIQADTANVTKGSVAYGYLYKIIIDFLAPSYNRFNTIRIALAPDAYNYLSFLPYSDVYSSKSVLATLAENLSDASNKIGRPIDVKFVSEPMLAASTVFNAEDYDYMVITSPEVKTGVDEKSRDLILCGVPLDEFVYPVIPGQYLTQHKMLKRYAGIFAPVAEAVKVYSGFGVTGS